MAARRRGGTFPRERTWRGALIAKPGVSEKLEAVFAREVGWAAYLLGVWEERI